jgi:cyclic pyranopterin phosphate synthase
MVKGVDRSAAIRDVRLLEKSGGKSGEWHRATDGTPPPSRAPQKHSSFRKRPER